MTAITFMLIYLNSCNGPTPNKNSIYEANKPNTTTQLNGLDAAVNSIDKNEVFFRTEVAIIGLGPMEQAYIVTMQKN